MGTQFRQLVGSGRADDRADETVACFAAVRCRPLPEAVGHVAVQGFAVDKQILKFAADALLVRTRTKIPLCSRAATFTNGSTPSLPRYGLTVSASACHEGSNEPPSGTLPRYPRA